MTSLRPSLRLGCRYVPLYRLRQTDTQIIVGIHTFKVVLENLSLKALVLYSICLWKNLYTEDCIFTVTASVTKLFSVSTTLIQCGLTEGQPCASMLEGDDAQGDDAKFKVVNNCMEILLGESYFQSGIFMTRGVYEKWLAMNTTKNVNSPNSPKGRGWSSVCWRMYEFGSPFYTTCISMHFWVLLQRRPRSLKANAPIRTVLDFKHKWMFQYLIVVF